MDIAVRLTAPGGTDRLEVVSIRPTKPAAGEILVRHEAIGVNFVDVYHRTGLYPLPSLPAILGVEGIGIVEALGAGVSGTAVGERIVYAGSPVGSYASRRVLPASRAILAPDDIPSAVIAGSVLRGLTAHMLLTNSFAVGASHTLLITAAAGGLGRILVRWAKNLGARVIGTVSVAEKAELAKWHGADHVIIGRDADLSGAVRALTKGAGVDYAIDGVGGETLIKTIDCVAPTGVIASIGQSAGKRAAVPADRLGSRSFRQPSIMAYSADPATYASAGQALFQAARRGVLVGGAVEYDLHAADNAQNDLEAGRTTGSIVLKP